MKSLATQWLENEVVKKENELMAIKVYQDFVKLQMALDYSKKLDEKKYQQSEESK